jgi:cytochrome c peroxidase
VRQLAVILASVIGALGSTRALNVANEPLAPLPDAPELDAQKVELGHHLFFDVRLSKGGRLSCASCHLMMGDGAGVSPYHLPKDIGIDGNPAPMNSPSIFNAAYNFRQRWRADGGTLGEAHYMAKGAGGRHINGGRVRDAQRPEPQRISSTWII